MSFLESGEGRFRWMIASAGASQRKLPGCVQCGNGIERVAIDPHDYSGRCFNCQGWICDEDEAFEDLED